MDLALSNFAWDNSESEIVFNTIKENGFNKIETILTKIDDWSNLNDHVILSYKENLTNYGIVPYSIQSLFYNVECNGLSDYNSVINHMEKLIHYSKLLDVKILVLGSPKLRKQNELLGESLNNTFKQIDFLLEGTDIRVLIEPNSKIYNGTYFHQIHQIVDFIDKYDLKNVGTMIDTHNSILENGNPIIEISQYLTYINHIHISEIGLKPIERNDFHMEFSNILKDLNYEHTITYEVMKNDDVMSSIKTFGEIYNKN